MNWKHRVLSIGAVLGALALVLALIALPVTPGNPSDRNLVNFMAISLNGVPAAIESCEPSNECSPDYFAA
jgi:predicted membrane protein